MQDCLRQKNYNFFYFCSIGINFYTLTVFLVETFDDGNYQGNILQNVNITP